ncbi:MAG: protein adenylyltransferase SelO [Beijerinckiaceae bacterium]
MPSPAFDNSYARLPAHFYEPRLPSPVKAPRLLKLNRTLAESLGLDANWLASDAGVAMLSGNAFPEGAASMAMVYAGHQFGQFTPQLGDGRALLVGEIVTPDGERRDIQLKGSGRTAFSRGGDGRAALGPVLREYLISEAMHALGIPTTRALAAVATGEHMWRETPQPGGIVTRVAASHIRVGTFQFFASRGDTKALAALSQHVMARHYPAVLEAQNPVLAMLDAVIDKQAALIAQWMAVGFIHGVMNTDNMTVSGETIDYGPCAFMDAYDPQTVFSAIDRGARYAFGNQPKIAHWNLARFAEALLPLLDADANTAMGLATDAINRFPALFADEMTARLRAKLGLHTAQEGDLALAQDLLQTMASGNADYTLSFRLLCDAADGKDAAFRDQFAVTGAVDAWLAGWRARLAQEPDSAMRSAQMSRVNPAIIPRNHNVEAALAAAVEGDDLTLFDALHEALAKPFDDLPVGSDLGLPPATVDEGYRTFCGT